MVYFKNILLFSLPSYGVVRVEYPDLKPRRQHIRKRGVESRAMLTKFIYLQLHEVYVTTLYGQRMKKSRATIVCNFNMETSQYCAAIEVAMVDKQHLRYMFSTFVSVSIFDY